MQRYEGGKQCSGGKDRATVIEFICNQNAGAFTVPKYIGEGVDGLGHCEYKFTWDTPAGCPITNEVKQDETSGDTSAILDNCDSKKMQKIAQTDSSAQFAWWDADTHATDKYVINPCSPVTGAEQCDSGSVCLFAGDGNGGAGGKWVSLGQFRNKERTASTLGGQ